VSGSPGAARCCLITAVPGARSAMSPSKMGSSLMVSNSSPGRQVLAHSLGRGQHRARGTDRERAVRGRERRLCHVVRDAGTRVRSDPHPDAYGAAGEAGWRGGDLGTVRTLLRVQVLVLPPVADQWLHVAPISREHDAWRALPQSHHDTIAHIGEADDGEGGPSNCKHSALQRFARGALGRLLRIAGKVIWWLTAKRIVFAQYIFLAAVKP